jgi:hypothetical protein
MKTFDIFLSPRYRNLINYTNGWNTKTQQGRSGAQMDGKDVKSMLRQFRFLANLKLILSEINAATSNFVQLYRSS